MTQCNSLNVKLSNSQLSRLKSAIKNETEVVLGLSSNMIDDSDNKINFPHELLLTNRQFANLRKSKPLQIFIHWYQIIKKLSNIIQSGGFLGRLLGPLLKQDYR